MAKLVKAISNIAHGHLFMMPDEQADIVIDAFRLTWHWQLIDTTPAEVAYFNTLGDNE